MKKIIFLIISSFLIFYGCETNPPTEPTKLPEEFGKVFITANIDGANIFVDDVNTGKVTPDTVQATVGNHEIKLEKENFLPSVKNVDVKKDSVMMVAFTLQPATLQKIVLLEDFANVSCLPCVTSNKIIESLLNNTYGTEKLVAVKFPTNFPGPGDPFYNANKTDCDSRISYYNIFSAPTVIIDGTERPISTDSISIKDAIDQQLTVTPKIMINVDDSLTSSTYFITVTVNVIDGSGLDFSNIVLHTIVTETDIEFANPPGANGETKFYNVMRTMLPSNAGESLDGISLNEDVVFLRQVNITPAWSGTLHTVVFIQNVQTKEVYQAASTF